MGEVFFFFFVVSARPFFPQDMVAFLGVSIIADTRIERYGVRHQYPPPFLRNQTPF